MTQLMKVGEVLLTEEQINRRVTELAEAVNRDYPEGELIVIGILKGCFVFISDLVRQLSGDVQIYFMQVSSYGNGTESSGRLTIKKDVDVDIAGKACASGRGHCGFRAYAFTAGTPAEAEKAQIHPGLLPAEQAIPATG